MTLALRIVHENSEDIDGLEVTANPIDESNDQMLIPAAEHVTMATAWHSLKQEVFTVAAEMHFIV